MASPRRYPESLPWRPRLIIGVLVGLAHLALLATARAPHPAGSLASTVGALRPSSLTWVEITAPPAPPHAAVAERAPTPAPAPKADLKSSHEEPIANPEDLGLPAPRTDLEPDPLNGPPATPSLASLAGLADPTDRCQLGQHLATALQADPRVQSALALIPRESRSVANAIMVWDGQWVRVSSAVGAGGVEPIHLAIVDGLAGIPADCWAQVNSGPLLIPIIDPAGTTVLAIGSGAWRAIDLIAQTPGATYPEALAAVSK